MQIPFFKKRNKVVLKKTSSVSARTSLSVYVCTAEVAIMSNGTPRQIYLEQL